MQQEQEQQSELLLTLTGATLLGNTTSKTPNKHNHSSSKTCNHHQHHHDGHSHHQQHQTQQNDNVPLSSSVNSPTSSSSTMVPIGQHYKQQAYEIVSKNLNNPTLLYQVVTGIVKMGTYDFFIELIHTWIQLVQEQHVLQKNETGKELLLFDVLNFLQQYDPSTSTNQYTLLHWASKRVDDVRFVQYILDQMPWPIVDSTATTSSSSSNYPTPVHRPSIDATAMTPLHWACTVPNALPMIKLLLDSENNTSTSTGTGGTNSTNNTKIVSTTSTKTKTKLIEICDGSGCTPLLLASQHGNVDVVAYLLTCHHANLYATDTSYDTAIHWAAYKGSLQVLGLLLYYYYNQHENNNNNNRMQEHPLLITDSYGQTPMHLAALRGHTSTCRYMIQQLLFRQQHMNHSSASSSSTMKDYRIVNELLSMKDKNQRTPYELALHKEKHNVAYYIQQVQDDVMDHIGRTSTNNNKNNRKYYYYWIIQRLSKQISSTMKSFVSISSWKRWLGIGTMNVIDEYDTTPQFPIYYVYFQIVCHILYLFTILMPFTNTINGLLWDCITTFSCSVSLMIGTIVSLYYIQTTNPGTLISSSSSSILSLQKRNKDNLASTTMSSSSISPYETIDYWKRLYGETLEKMALSVSDSTNNSNSSHKHQQYNLCHTCHIAKPYRSKHCSHLHHACVMVYDHYCPFVSSTIGLYNYRFFYMFLVCMTLYFVCYWMMFVYYWSRMVSKMKHCISIIFGLYLGIHALFPTGMLIVHTQLVCVNLTTNEHMNMNRYDYLWRTTNSTSSSSSNNNNNNNNNRSRYYYNPWDKGWIQNFINRIVSPSSETCYIIPDEQERLLLSNNNNHINHSFSLHDGTYRNDSDV